mmetsp:Transcript_92912/g.268288  ORF Transcript_92912/g.268288 Transcript_92912/m.268288 type:complete len:332 (+) Transcript_92912:385-1380(+)
MPRFAPPHVLGRDRTLVLRVVEHEEDGQGPLDVHHRHGAVEIRAVVDIRGLEVDDARHGLAPQRVELQGPAGCLRRWIDVVAVAEDRVVQDVVRDTRWALVVPVAAGLIDDLRPQHLHVQLVAAYPDSDMADRLGEGIVLPRHAGGDADQGTGVVPAHQPGDLPEASGDGLLPAPAVLDDMLQRGEEDALGPHDGDLRGGGRLGDELLRRLRRERPCPDPSHAADPADLVGREAHPHHGLTPLPEHPDGCDDDGEEAPEDGKHVRYQQRAMARAGGALADGPGHAAGDVRGHGVVQEEVVEEDAARAILVGHRRRLHLPAAVASAAVAHVR